MSQIHADHMGQMMLDNLMCDPDGVCQIDGESDKTETRRSLRNRAIKMAKHMLFLGLKRNDIIAICCYNHLDTCLPFAAGLLIGVATNGIDVMLSELELEHLTNLTKPKLIFCEPFVVNMYERILKKLNLDSRIVVVGDCEKSDHMTIKEFYENDYPTADFEVVNFDPANTLAYILCSSGSTGLPKGVCLSHSTLMTHCRGIKATYTNSIMLQFSSMYWISGMAITMLMLTANAIKINSKPFTAELFFKLVPKYKVKFVVLLPSLLRIVVRRTELETADLTSLQMVMVSGFTVDMEDIQRLQKCLPQTKVMNSYGLSEIGGPVTYTLKTEIPKYGSCGRLMPYIKSKIVDPNTKQEKRVNEVGELYLKCLHMMTGYINDPITTAATIDKDGWLKTGDLAKIDEDGYLFIVDRVKDIFKVRGFSVSPTVLENVINSYPGVKDSVVVGIENKDTGYIPVAYIIREQGSGISAEEIKEYVKQKLSPVYNLTGGVAFVDKFEKTASGKVKRNKMKDLVKSSSIE